MFGVIADYEPDQDVGVNGACFLRMYFRIAQGNERPSTRLHGNERRQHDPDEGSLLSLAIYRHFIYIMLSIRKVTGQQALGDRSMGNRNGRADSTRHLWLGSFGARSAQCLSRQ